MVKWIVLLVVTLIALLTSPALGAEQSEMDCLAEAIYYESRSETTIAQLAVGTVVLNRVKSKRYPSTICGVVHQGCQFSYYCDGKPEYMVDKRARAVSYAMVRLLSDSIMVGGLEKATHYHAFYVAPAWASKLTFVGRYGSHLFYNGE